MITLVTQVVVDKNDPSLRTPKKPIGPFYSEEKARQIEQTYSWKVFGDSERGYRLVVPSPAPIRVVETPVIKSLLEKDVIVIAVGGGGIPVIIEDDNTYEGVDVVVEKDLSAELADRIKMVLEDRAEAMVGPRKGKGYKTVNDGRWPERTEAFWLLAAQVLARP